MRDYYIVFDRTHKTTPGYCDTLYFSSERCEDILHHFKGFMRDRNYQDVVLMKFDTKKQWDDSYREWLKTNPKFNIITRS